MTETNYHRPLAAVFVTALVSLSAVPTAQSDGASDALDPNDSLGGIYELPGLLLEAALAPPSKQCFDDSPGGGLGGNKAACAFRCDKNDMLSVSVKSTDSDAGVAGTGQCGEATAHCTGTQYCEGVDGPTESSGAGKCTANSDELWRSYLSVRCKATGACAVPVCRPGEGPGLPSLPDPDVPDVFRFIPEIPNPELPNPELPNPELPNPEVPVLPNPELPDPQIPQLPGPDFPEIPNPDVIVTILVDLLGKAVGEVCTWECLPVIPVLFVDGEGRPSWTIDSTSLDGTNDPWLQSQLETLRGGSI